MPLTPVVTVIILLPLRHSCFGKISSFFQLGLIFVHKATGLHVELGHRKATSVRNEEKKFSNIDTCTVLLSSM